jgi:hypothetical protein
MLPLHRALWLLLSLYFLALLLLLLAMRLLPGLEQILLPQWLLPLLLPPLWPSLLLLLLPLWPTLLLLLLPLRLPLWLLPGKSVHGPCHSAAGCDCCHHRTQLGPVVIVDTRYDAQWLEPLHKAAQLSTAAVL